MQDLYLYVIKDFCTVTMIILPTDVLKCDVLKCIQSRDYTWNTHTVLLLVHDG